MRFRLELQIRNQLFSESHLLIKYLLFLYLDVGTLSSEYDIDPESTDKVCELHFLRVFFLS